MGEELNKLFGGASEIFFAPIGDEKMQGLGNIITGSTSLSFDLADDPDWETILGIREESGKSMVCPLTISWEPYIHSPKNLKYPNKKRARRIWKKWAKRYGVTPAQTIYFPNVEISCGMDDRGRIFNVMAKPIDNGREDHKDT